MKPISSPSQPNVAESNVDLVKASSSSSRWVKMASLFQLRWFRITLLVSVCIFEVFLTYFLKRAGWLGAIDWGTQVMVVVIILSPLLLALLVIAGRSFRLSSMMIALTLSGVFMGFVMLPVNKEIRARTASQKFADLGVLFGRRSHFFDYAEYLETGKREVHEIESVPVAKWIDRLTTHDLSLCRDLEVANIRITSQQFDSVESVIGRCANLDSVWLQGGWPEKSLKNAAKVMNSTQAKVLIVGDFGAINRMPMRISARLNSWNF